MSSISVPTRFETNNLRNFFLDLDNVIEEKEVTLDFSPLVYSKPIAMLVAGSKLRQWVQYRSLNGLVRVSKIPEGNLPHSDHII